MAETKFLRQFSDVGIMNTYCRIWDSLMLQNEAGFLRIWRPSCVWMDGERVVEIYYGHGRVNTGYRMMRINFVLHYTRVITTYKKADR